LLGELGLEGVLTQADALQCQMLFSAAPGPMGRLLLTVNAKRKTLDRQTCSQLQGARKIPSVVENPSWSSAPA